MHLEFLLEEPSSEAFLSAFLPRAFPEVAFALRVFQGKSDLLANLPARLRGYRHWIPEDWRIVVLVDEDREDCLELKAQLEAAAATAGLSTKTSANGGTFTILNRVVVEELEAWFLGDAQALRTVYPGISQSFSSKAKYRDPDSITGGTWEALERLLQAAGYFTTGLRKIELARNLGAVLGTAREQNRSRSFGSFMTGLSSALSQ
jgi:hypothetical protein